MKKLTSILLKSIKIYPFVFLAFSVVACDFQGEGDKEECEDTICTLIFISLNVEVVNSANEPLALDSYTVTDTQSGRDLTPDFSNIPFEDMQASGFYTFFSDAWQDVYKNETTTLRFSGFVNGQEVATAEFEVAADCCHVSLVSGDTKIKVD